MKYKSGRHEDTDSKYRLNVRKRQREGRTRLTKDEEQKGTETKKGSGEQNMTQEDITSK